MEMLVFRMSKQFPSEIKKTHSAKEDIVSSKVKMNMIHEAFFYNICATCGNVRYWYFILRMKTKNLTVDL